MKTVVAKPLELKRKWYVVDAEGQTLGRLAAKVAAVLIGKDKPIFTPNVDCGDYVIVINAEKISMTGDKWQQKEYRHHSNYPGGLKCVRYADFIRKHPTQPVELAVKGMLPHTKLGRQMYRKLKVYAGAEHEQQAQKPEELKL